MDYDGLLELVKKRRSVRHFKPDPIPDEYVEKILELARWAPSALNAQPCRLTTKVSHRSTTAIVGSRLVNRRGICQRTRVLRRIGCGGTLASNSACSVEDPGLVDPPLLTTVMVSLVCVAGRRRNRSCGCNRPPCRLGRKSACHDRGGGETKSSVGYQFEYDASHAYAIVCLHQTSPFLLVVKQFADLGII